MAGAAPGGVGAAPNGGTFSGTGVSQSNGSYVFDPSVVPLGTPVTITYTVSDGFGGTNSATFTITVFEQPSLVVTTTSDVVSNTDGVTSLREAVAYAATLTGPQTIQFNIPTSDSGYSNGVYTITLAGTELAVSSDVTIQGPGVNVLTVSGNHASRVFHIKPGTTVTISGLTVSNGQTSGNFFTNTGAGIYNDHATLTITNSTISGNHSDGGSGSGGGIDNDGDGSSATLTISNSTVSGNSAGNGGGIFSWGGIGAGGGGGSNATVTISNSTLSGNSAAASGAGIYNDAQRGNATATISNSTLSGNNATTEHGGGIYNDGALSGHATLMLSNSTLSGNSARFHGGSIYNDGARSGSATLTIGNTILNASGAENVYNDAGVIRSQGYNLNTQLRGIVNADGGTGERVGFHGGRGT